MSWLKTDAIGTFTETRIRNFIRELTGRKKYENGDTLKIPSNELSRLIYRRL